MGLQNHTIKTTIQGAIQGGTKAANEELEKNKKADLQNAKQVKTGQAKPPERKAPDEGAVLRTALEKVFKFAPPVFRNLAEQILQKGQIVANKPESKLTASERHLINLAASASNMANNHGAVNDAFKKVRERMYLLASAQNISKKEDGKPILNTALKLLALVIEKNGNLT